ncbi:magnesium transporter MRS2-11, chloroplastic [Olea europaea subsp. europaea]|uniref:Magnesium transporter MRS2-11, chloroplastic n=1 Tax=Olea europaea subsp. europaea TaxID=158383 RepID=A0A8S0RLP0_OLEEU|nr:magnesium transporter MRS2-11, chloroplastic [Olea europaea subsp. europaea]
MTFLMGRWLVRTNRSVGLVRSPISDSVPGDSLNLGIRKPIYEVVEVRSDGNVSTRKNNETTLLEVRRKGGKAFIDALLPRLNPKNMNGRPSTPFVLEVVEAALHSRIQRLEQRLWDLEPCVQALLEVLPYRLAGDILEELRISKQRLVELGSRAGATKQMLLDILEDTHEIRRVCIMGRNCTLQKNDEMECYVPVEKQIAEGVNLVMVRQRGFLIQRKKWKIPLQSTLGIFPLFTDGLFSYKLLEA